MRNIELYGHAKVNKELQERASVIERLPSEGEKTARIMAWNSFVQDQIDLEDSNERTANLAKLKYGEAVDLLPQHGLVMDLDAKKFVDHFFDELSVINRKVTNKGVQIVFYVFVALGLFGIYKIFV